MLVLHLNTFMFISEFNKFIDDLNYQFQLNYKDSDEMTRECLINLMDEDVRNASVNCGNGCSQLLFIMLP